MCRFLIIRSKKKFKPEKLLTAFSLMCQKSRSPDGDWQGDGWGIAWKEKNKWLLKKSLLPIWKENINFKDFPETQLLVVHARSAGFPRHKGIISHNQPYIDQNLCFVFNGMILGVNLQMRLAGDIGAQKIFSFIKKEIIKNSPNQTLRKLDKTLSANSRKIIGMNIGVVKNNRIYVLCEYSENSRYFGLYYYQDKKITLVCSERIDNFNWYKMSKGDVLNL